MPSAHNLDGYGTTPIAWERVTRQIGTEVPQVPGQGGPGRHTAWLTTLNADGSPHVRPLGIVPLDGAWYFNSGAETVKTKNLQRRRRCVLSMATEPFDLVVEGDAVRVTQSRELASVAAVFGKDWPCTVDGDALTAEFSAPSAGKPPYFVFRLDAERVYAFGAQEPYGATRFDM